MPASIAILLCTYNAGPYLAAQLESLEKQTWLHWQCWASDDGSTDDTLAVLQAYQARWGSDKLTIQRGPGKGAAANFMSLIHDANVDADYFAWCDQDDIWEPDKLARAVEALATTARKSGADLAHMPSLYGSRTRTVNEQNHDKGLSPLFPRPAGFRNALVQNIASGNTMVFTRSARILMQSVPAAQPLFMHDWWTYVVVTACGGQVVMDPWPSVRYRQHAGNVIGHRRGLADRLRVAGSLLDGRYAERLRRHLAALRHLEQYMTPEALRCQAQFARVTGKSNGALRLQAFLRSGVYRQRRRETFILALLALAGRL